MNFVTGKRVKIGAAITSTAAVLAFYFPNHAPAIVAAAVPITFVAQVLIAKYFGITSADPQ